MRIPASSARRRARIEIIPLIDIMFFLLATFIMVSLSMIQNLGLPVNLPAAHTSKPDSTKPAATITVTRDGKIYWNKEAADLGTLGRELKSLAASDPEAKVFIHGDKKADFGTVIQVLDQARQAGIRHTSIRTTPGER